MLHEQRQGEGGKRGIRQRQQLKVNSNGLTLTQSVALTPFSVKVPSALSRMDRWMASLVDEADETVIGTIHSIFLSATTVTEYL